MKFKTINNCLACGSRDLLKVLDLGSQPLANSYRDVNDDTAEETFPLLLSACQECFHAQISVAVDPSVLYEEYSYVSGTTSTLKSYFAEFAVEIIKNKVLPPYTQTKQFVVGIDERSIIPGGRFANLPKTYLAYALYSRTFRPKPKS